MSFNSNADLKSLLHPYTFALKAGKGLNQDYLDYSLMILQVSCPETIKSPPHYAKVKPIQKILKSPAPKNKEELEEPLPLSAMHQEI